MKTIAPWKPWFAVTCVLAFALLSGFTMRSHQQNTSVATYDGSAADTIVMGKTIREYIIVAGLEAGASADDSLQITITKEGGTTVVFEEHFDVNGTTRVELEMFQPTTQFIFTRATGNQNNVRAYVLYRD